MKKPIIDYTILVDYTAHTLITQVKHYIQRGWVPQGGVCENSHGTTLKEWSQAMVKYSL